MSLDELVLSYVEDDVAALMHDAVVRDMGAKLAAAGGSERYIDQHGPTSVFTLRCAQIYHSQRPVHARGAFGAIALAVLRCAQQHDPESQAQ